MWPAVPTTSGRAALFADAAHLLHLVFVVLAEEHLVLGASLGDVALLGQDALADALFQLLLVRHLRLEDLQDLQPHVVLVLEELDPVVVLEEMDDQVGEMDAALVAEPHQITIFRSLASLALTLRKSCW